MRWVELGQIANLVHVRWLMIQMLMCGFFSTDIGQEFRLSIPKTIELPFLGVVNWPPEVQIVNLPYICRETVDTAHGATIVEEIINERTYCVTKNLKALPVVHTFRISRISFFKIKLHVLLSR